MSSTPRSTRSTRKTTSTSTDPAAGAALREALDGLTARPRVHELARRAQMSSKEIISALADRGVTVASASSGVDLADATDLLTSLLGDPESSAPAESVGSITPAHALPVADRPLFLPPEAVAPPRRRRTKTVPQTGEPDGAADPAATEPAATGPAATEPAASGPAESGSDQESRPDSDGSDPASSAPPRSRRRRGRGRGAADAEPVTVTEPAAIDAGDTTVGPDESTADTDDRLDDEPASEAGQSAARKRRRRGRRGRGRISDDLEGDDDSDQTASAAGPTTRPADDTDRTAGAEPAEDSDADTEGDPDAESDSDADQGTRRRRRRRRRSGGSGDSGDAQGGDDPDNTVVHVREPRREPPTDEVQGIRGSTRLEAKRQRRRDGRGAARRPAILTEAEFLARREAVDRVMAVRQRGDIAQVALLEDNVLVEHFVSRAGSASMIGNVYLGKVQNVLPSMEAAFVDIGRGRNAVLYAGEVNWDASGLVGKTRRIEAALSSGDAVLVQVSKDPVGHKGARLTTQISLPGRFLVYVPGGGATGISRKLPDTERKRLKAILDRIVPEDAGVIIRTAAEGVPEEELQRDVERLKEQWADITKAAEKVGSAPKQLSVEPDTLIKVVRDLFNSDINRLVVDGDEAWTAIDEYVTGVAPELADRVSRYTESGGSNDVFGRYRIDEQIAKALERKVHLPSGGSLVIDRTEAMTVVDVNTGKYTGSGGNLEETVTRNNLEAAEEIVRQLRLRDIGGIIVVDFIDMVLESNRDLVLRRLTECLGRDRTRHQVAEVTSLGLVQMTRKRMGTGLVEAFSEPCSHCGGRGIVLHDVPVDTGGSDEEEPKSGRGRRQRGRRSDDGARDVKDSGRDSGREPEVPILSVLSTRPDPRGPRGPRPAALSGAGLSDSAVHPVDDGLDGPSGYEDRGGSDLSPADIAEVVLAARSAGAGDVAVDPVEERVEEALAADETVGLPSGEDVADVVAEATAAVAAAVASETTALLPETSLPADGPVNPPARRRRSAGRPAGAPSVSSAAVDIVLPSGGGSTVPTAPVESEPTIQAVDKPARKRASRSRKATSAAASEPASDPSAEAVNGAADLTQDGATAQAVAAVLAVETAPPTRAPRRRRAATRPSGPAGQPVTVTGPAQSTD